MPDNRKKPNRTTPDRTTPKRTTPNPATPDRTTPDRAGARATPDRAGARAKPAQRIDTRTAPTAAKRAALGTPRTFVPATTPNTAVLELSVPDRPVTNDRSGSQRHLRRPPTGQMLIRAAVVLMAGLSAGFELTPWVSTPLTLVAALLTVEWLVRYRRRGLADAAVVGAAGLALALAGTGLVLNMLPAGLTTTTWAIGGTFVALDALFLGLRTDMPPSLWAQWGATRTPAADGRTQSALMLNLGCVAVAIAVITGAFVVATRSANDTVVYPVAISMSGEAPAVTLSVTTGGQPATYDLWVRAEDGTVIAAAQIALTADAPAEVPLTLPTTGRVLIELTPTGATTPVRELIVDNGQLTEESS